ncbi:hypothetical protein GCM10020229_14850 [Kitasatospora albolonga]
MSAPHMHPEVRHYRAKSPGEAGPRHSRHRSLVTISNLTRASGIAHRQSDHVGLLTQWQWDKVAVIESVSYPSPVLGLRGLISPPLPTAYTASPVPPLCRR